MVVLGVGASHLLGVHLRSRIQRFSSQECLPLHRNLQGQGSHPQDLEQSGREAVERPFLPRPEVQVFLLPLGLHFISESVSVIVCGLRQQKEHFGVSQV